MQEESNVIQIGGIDAKERLKRTYEIRAAIGIAVFVVACSWLQLTFYGMDSWMFIILFNINAILMLLALFLVARNVVKLIIERRRNVFGSRIRSRIVLIFVMLTLVPTVVVFLASNRVVSTSVDYWFTTQTENSLQAALDVGQRFYATAVERLRERAEVLDQEIREHRIKWNSREMSKLLSDVQRNAGLCMVAIAGPDGRLLNSFSKNGTAPAWEKVHRSIIWKYTTGREFVSSSLADETADYVVGVLPVDKGESGYLVMVENIGSGLIATLSRISRGFTEYAQLKQLKKPLKVSLQLILAVLAMFTLFGAIWYGFRLSKEITAPLLALAEGTTRIAKGELNFQLEDMGSDELAQLVQSFNLMAEDLRDSRESLTRANALLARQNTAMDERRHYIETVLDNITTGIITLDAAGRLQTINKAACATFRTSIDILYGKTPANFLPQDYVPAFFDMMETLQAQPEHHWQRQVDFIMLGQTWKLVVNAVALCGKNGIQTYIIAIEDITELEKMQRMAAWREVARRIAHEIKNPLTPIKLSAQRLARKFGSGVQDPAFTQCTDLIVNQSERLQEMVQEFSAFAKLPEVDLRLGHLKPIIDELVSLFRTSHPHIQWEASVADALPMLLMDKAALHRALMNLMTNSAEAIESMPPPAVPRAMAVYLSAKADPSHRTVRITVADTGPGLTPEEHDRLFEPYFSRKKGGTGLGLAIVKSIISDHRGSIRVSASCEGTTIIIDLPQCDFTPGIGEIGASTSKDI